MMTRGKQTWLFVIASTAAIVAIVATSFALLFTHSAAPAQAATGGNGDGIGTPQYLTEAPSGTVSSRAVTIPNWGSSFTDPTNGVTYPYSMVGANPKSDSSTTVPFVIIPLDFTFANNPYGVNPTLAGSSKVSDTLDSPIFNGSADIGAATSTASAAPTYPGVAPSPRTENEPSDTTQVGDAFVRAQWNKAGTGYHVLLSATVLPTVSIPVPQNQGVLVVGSVSHARIGLMSYYWFSARLQNLMVSMHIAPTVVPLFLTYNTFLYIGSTSNCCVLGYHGATSSLNGNGKQQINTYMYAAYSDPGIFRPNPGDNGFSYIQDIHALSHEVSEWLDDPFINNAVNPWLTPTAPQYGCTSDLEVGDPVVGYGFTVKMPSGAQYHPEDEVFFSWFARQSPSISSAGYYTYLNNFANVAQGC